PDSRLRGGAAARPDARHRVVMRQLGRQHLQRSRHPVRGSQHRDARHPHRARVDRPARHGGDGGAHGRDSRGQRARRTGGVMGGRRTAAALATSQGRSSFLRRLRDRGLSPKQRLLARYIADHYRTAAGQTAAEVAASNGTSEATVIRLARELGYDGFPELRRQLHHMVREDLTSLELLARERARPGRARDALTNVIETEMAHLQALLASTDRDDFSRLVDGLLEARRVYIAGHRASTSLAQFFGYSLAKVHPDVVTLTEHGSGIYDTFVTVPPGTWLVALGFRRYPRETVELIGFAREEGIRVAA